MTSAEGPAGGEMLLVEDLMLLMLADDGGSIAGAGTLHHTLGGAVLVELALRGAVEADESETGLTAGLEGRRVHAVDRDPFADPLLQAAYEQVAGRPRRVPPLVLDIGAGLWRPVIDRLVERGLIHRERKRVLRLFRRTVLPAADAAREAHVRESVRAVLVDGADPDPRTAALVALLSASGTLPVLRPQLVWSGDVARRAKAIEDGHWGAAAVGAAVTRTAAAIAAATAAATAAASVTVLTSGS